MSTIFLIILAYFLVGFCSAIIAVIISAKNYYSLEEAFYDNETGYIITLFVWPMVDVFILILAFRALFKKLILLGIKIVSKFYKY